MRFIDYFCGLNFEKGPIQQSELVMTELKLLAFHQKEYFGTELDILQARTLKYSGRLLALDPIYDEETSILSIGGRLAQGSYSPEMTHSALVDGKSYLAVLLIQKANRTLLHRSPSHTSRTQTTILDSRWSSQRTWSDTTMHNLSSLHSKAVVPRMADLPTERITPSRPFTRTGLDFAGPLTIKSPISKATQMSYIFIFVCFSTKAISYSH